MNSKKQGKSDRLFVPLSAEPYAWFKSGQKRWELRKYGRQYTEKYVRPNRKVELRHGYSDPNQALWGTIISFRITEDLKNFFDRVPYEQVIPIAQNLDDAIAISKKILQIAEDKPVPIIGFEVSLDYDNHLYP